MGPSVPQMLFDREGAGCDFEEIHILQDRTSGLKAILAIHSTRIGPAFGGIRRFRYDTEEEALDDVLRLACWMSRKCSLADLPAGGAKMVILDHPGLDRNEAYRAIGRHLERMAGRYVCGPDVGTDEDDLDRVREETRAVNPKGNDAGRSTAHGVLAGLRGVLRSLDGDPGFDGRSFLVQGLGAVGRHVATGLMDEGATVLAADIDEELHQAGKEAGLVTVPPEAALTVSCDVLVPCAMGGILTPQVAGDMQVKAICGSANNQLASEEAGDVLHGRGILYAPDIVVNSGAVIEGFYTVREGATDAVRRRAYDHIDEIEGTVHRILERSREEDIPPARLAAQMADERLAAAIEKTTDARP